MKTTIRFRSAKNIFHAVAAAVLFATVLPLSQAQEHKAVNLSTARGLPFSDGIIAGNTLYIANQEGTDESDKLVPGGVARKPPRRSRISREC